MSELVIDSKDTMSGRTKPTCRESPYQCRLPPELITKVLDYLTHDQSLGTLAKLQSTSSAIYTLVTPYLYRHIIVNQVQLITLFRLFETFPRSDNKRFLEEVVPLKTHLLDLHIVYRLRKFFSYTRELSIVFLLDQNLEAEMNQIVLNCLDRYKEIAIGLSAFSGPSLWPRLLRCNIDMPPYPMDIDAWQSHNEVCDHLIRLVRYEKIVEAVPANIHPKHLYITLPDKPSYTGDYDMEISWEPWFRRLHADNIELVVERREYECIPHATSTFTLRFHPWTDHTSRDNRVRITQLLRDNISLDDVDEVKIIGILPPIEEQYPAKVTSVAAALDEQEIYIARIMSRRLTKGNSRDFKIAIMADSTTEGQAAAVWRTYNQPKVEQEAE